MLHLPTLEEKIDGEFEDVEEGIQLPGIRTIPGICMPSTVMNKKSKNYEWFVYHGRRFKEAKGIVVNTFEELEHEPLRVLADGLFVPDDRTPPIYPVGPLLCLGDGHMEGANRHECLKWLDAQPPASVVYLCFGSMGCFGAEQVSSRKPNYSTFSSHFDYI